MKLLREQPSPYWLDRFEREIGVAEIPGEADNPRILEYFKSLAGGPFAGHKWKDEDDWCAVSMNWLFESAGIPGTNSPAAIAFMKWGREIAVPRKGCVAVFYRFTPERWESHVGLIVDEDENNYLVLGGNQNHQMGYTWIAKYRLREHGLRWPLAIDIVRSINRRGSFRSGTGRLAGEIPVPAGIDGVQINTKIPWYRKIDIKGWLSRLLSAAGSALQFSPRYAPIGDLLLTAGKKLVKKKQETPGWVEVLRKLFDLLISFLKRIFNGKT